MSQIPPIQTPQPAPPKQGPVPAPPRRRTLPSAIGEPMLWLTGGALTVCLAMIAILVTMVLVNGSFTFWPRPIDLLTLSDGEVVMGIETQRQAATDTTGASTLFRVGNRELGQVPYRWIDDRDIVSRERPADAVMLERESWGVWLGVPERIVRAHEDGETTVLADGPGAFFDAYDDLHARARRDLHKVERLKRSDLGAINAKLETSRLHLEKARIKARREQRGLFRFSWATWPIVLAGVLGLVAVRYRWRHYGTRLGSADARRGKLLRASAGVAALMMTIALLVGAPWMASVPSQAQLRAMSQRAAEKETRLLGEYDTTLERIRAIEREDSTLRVVVREPTSNRFAPTSQTLSDEPLHMSQIVRLVRANDLSLSRKAGVFFSRWWEFLSTFPREANTEGGVYPVIVGTVLLTLLLTVFVTPLGVIAALYLREYARQGLVTSLIRIAVNNLAGVPSIVYGVFGLGFFCYTVGQYVDTGPAPASRLGVGAWWGLFLATGLAVIAGIATRLWSRPDPGKGASRLNAWMGRVSWVIWGVCVVMAVVLVFKTPYFHGFFEARSSEGTPTFGTRGLLWASLTLALLTLPVVIVATEEAIAAVPNSMRQGSYGCGASKWQTMRRIVLPGALPGILTGAILAMARGAGEVAPLMLVGAVKLNQDLPISTQYPFLHADRSFMHLGFHIYDLGFQSPDSQAARPLVWTTTLLFLTIVFVLNLLAILLRSRLRSRMAGPTV